MPVRFTIDGFKANFRDGQRSNLWYFLPNFPATVVQGDMTNDRAVYLVKTGSIPGSSLEEIPLSWQGFDFNIAGKHTYEAINITFNTDYKALVRLNFEEWIKLIHNPVTNNYALMSDYMVDQRIQLLDYTGEPVLEYILHDAWPQAIAQATMDYAANEITMWEITFRYSYYEVTDQPTGQ
jgi:hypothetical protein